MREKKGEKKEQKNIIEMLNKIPFKQGKAQRSANII